MTTETRDTYQDQSANKVITARDLHVMAWRSLFLQASFNYERMQANGWLYTILPALRKIHKNPDDLRASMRMHLEFFNTHPLLVTFISGLVVSMEEAKENISTIRAIKVSTMGPGGGIGDAVIWFTLLSVCGGIGASFSINGSWFGPIFFLVAFNSSTSRCALVWPTTATKWASRPSPTSKNKRAKSAMLPPSSA